MGLIAAERHNSKGYRNTRVEVMPGTFSAVSTVGMRTKLLKLAASAASAISTGGYAMTTQTTLTSRDLWSLKFVGDPDVSSKAREIVWVETATNAKKNHYESSIWISRKKGKHFGTPARLTYGKRPDGDGALDRSPRFSPSGSNLAFISNRSGKNQLWVLDMMKGGDARPLTDWDDGISEITWSPCGEYLAFVSKEPKPKAEQKSGEIDTSKDVTVITSLRYKANGVPGTVDPRPNQIFLVGLDDGRIRRLTDGRFDNSSPAFSPDGKEVAFTSCREPDRELRMIPDLWTVPFDGGEAKRLTFGKGPVIAPAYSPDGKNIAFFGHEAGEDSVANIEVLAVPSGGGQVRHFWDGFDRSVGSGIGSDARADAGRAGPYWSKDGRFVYFVATDGGYAGIYRVSMEGPGVSMVGGAVPSRIEACPKYPPVVVSLAVADVGDGNVTFTFNGGSSLNPGDMYEITVASETCHVAGAPCPLRQLTEVNSKNLGKYALSTPEPFSFKSSDGLSLSGWMMKPIGFQDGEKYPAVLEVHGGPHAAFGEAFFLEFQLLAAAGFGVFYCNPRGSSGYGPEFARKVIGDWGGMDYQDVMALKGYMDSVPWVDASRIGITGGSYGGYMTNWVIGQTDRFQAAVTQRSISNMYTKYGTSDIGWYGNKRGMGGRDLWDSEDFIMERSPMRYVPNVKTPLLILHSEQDYRCPMEQAEQFYVALKRLGKDVEFVRFAGENHELSRSGKPWNRVERLNRIVGWFERKLRGD